MASFRNKTLDLVLVALRGQEVVVELKNDSEVRGIVDEIYPDHSILLRQALTTVWGSKGEKNAAVDVALVPGRAIRMVHIPPYVNVPAMVATHVKAMQRQIKKSQPAKLKAP